MCPSIQINPPLYVPLVEVIPSVHTSQEVVQRTVDLLKDLGKVPIVEKKELNGFVLNRLQYALIMEAWRLVEVSVVSINRITIGNSRLFGNFVTIGIGRF